MDVTLSSKIYVQLRPDDAALSTIQALQDVIDSSAQLVSKDAIHMTVIHIGLVSRFINSAHEYTSMPQGQIIKHLDTLVASLHENVTYHDFESFKLVPTNYDLFGENHNVYVLRFETTQSLRLLHEECLRILVSFLYEIGIKDPVEFMLRDYNLRNALTIKPHVSIARSYHGDKKQANLPLMYFSMMPILY